jgi:uncharacterized membrane protein YfcA
MSSIFQILDPSLVAFALAVSLFGGFIKGIVGFALPTVLISGLSLFLTPELALVGLLLPTVATNGWQALRQGVPAAMASVRRFRVFLGVGLVFMLASAQLLRVLPDNVLFLMLGIAITGFAAMQLLGVTFKLTAPSGRIEAAVGAFTGFIGGMSGIWGPPTVSYLTAINTEKSEHMRVQGVIYGLGAVALVFAHIGSGILTWNTLPLSIALVPPCLVGMWLGNKVHDRIDQQAFRRAILAVLIVAGLNLIRRGLF